METGGNIMNFIKGNGHPMLHVTLEGKTHINYISKREPDTLPSF